MTNRSIFDEDIVNDLMNGIYKNIQELQDLVKEYDRRYKEEI